MTSSRFDVSAAGLTAWKDAGVPDALIEVMQEGSDLLAAARDRTAVLRHFKTLCVDASKAVSSARRR
jgi:hypothetical protein